MEDQEGLRRDRGADEEPLWEVRRETRLSVVLNAKAGSRDAEETRALVESVWREAGQRYRIHEVRVPGDLERVAREAVKEAERESGAVVVAGGDGTINTVAQVVLPTGRPMGLLPQGTFNYTCRAHGIPMDLREAAEGLLRSRVTPVQVGRVNERIFLVNASLGLYPQLLEDREAFKRQYGRNRWVAMVAAMATLLKEPRRMRLRIESGEERMVVKTPTLFVGNNRLQLEQVGLAGADAWKRESLTGVVVRPIGSLGLFGLALMGALGRLGESRNIRVFVFDRMIVERHGWRRRRRVRVATDGEVWRARLPLEFGVARERLRLLTPVR